MATQTFPLVDRALGGTLVERLQEARAAGQSHQQIAESLAADGVEVSRETVRKWCRDLEVAK